MVDKQTFKCPKCGSSIKRTRINHTADNGIEYQTLSQPKCVNCGVRYVIKINEDLTYELEDLWFANTLRENNRDFNGETEQSL